MRRVRLSILAVGLGGLLALALIPVAIAQSRRLPPDVQVAARAFNEGRYDDVVTALQKLDPRDPAAAALIARAHIARGRYDQAEAVLQPAAERAPMSDAGLEL